MGERITVPFDTFSMQVEVPVSQLVRDGDFAWSCGQCPLGRDGRVMFKDDLAAQTQQVCAYIEALLRRGGVDGRSIAKLLVYHVAASPEDRNRMMSVLRRQFGAGPLIVPVAVPHFYYDGMMIEVDVFAGPVPESLALDTAPGLGLELNARRAGGLTWVTLRAHTRETEAALRAADLLAETGLSPANLLSDHWFVPASGHAEAMAATFHSAGLVTQPAAMVTTFGPGEGALVGALTFSDQPVRGTSSTHDTDTKVVTHSRRAGRLHWSCGTCDDSDLDLVGQTLAIMRAIEAALARDGATFENVAKLTALYVGGASVEELHGNMMARHSFYGRPGPASTGLPVTALNGNGCRISIDVVATI